ncbi:hypothetical protein [Sphingobacterium sp. MYb388]|uniref:hypothetical protein n=1 Tax=Sphingobacterium sp. MYb388 TaxID=2745437 RepID=UPI0030B3A61C
MNLSEKESAVLQEVQSANVEASSIANRTELSIASVHAVINSLVKKELLVKLEDKTLRLGAKFGEYIESLTQSKADQGDADPAGSDKPPVIIAITENGSSDNAENKSENKGIAIVIPYLRSEAAGDELRYALRSWTDHFANKHHVIVVGDREDWFSPEINHIPMDPVLILEDCNCAAPAEIRNPQADVTHKILALIAAGEIEGDFILSNDDIFLAGHTTLADIQSLKAFGDLEDHGKGASLYCKNALLTKRALEAENKATKSYGTHTPMLLNAEVLAEVIEKYGATEKGLLLTSLYFNDQFPNARPIQITGAINDPILASLYRDNAELALVKKVFAERKFVNCNAKGWISIEPVVKSIFANPSRYEKD